MPKEKNKENIEEEKEKKKSNALLVTILVVLLMVVSGAMGYALGGTKIINKVNGEDSVEKEETKEEIVVTDELKKDLSDKINTVLWSGKSDTYSPTATVNSYGFRADILKEKITAEDKQLVLLKSLEYRVIDGSKWREVEDITSWQEKDPTSLSEMGYLKYDEVNDAYKKLFGEELTNPVKVVGKCPSYLYSQETKEFYKLPARCGGTSAASVATYKSNYEVNEKEAIVTMNVAYLFPVEYSDNHIVYADFNIRDDKYPGDGINQIDTYTGYQYEYRLTEEKAKECSEYKVKFKKDDTGNYYFDSIEQVK